MSKAKKSTKERRRLVRAERKQQAEQRRQRERAEAEHQRRVEAIRAEMDRSGITEQVGAVRKAVQDPMFVEQLRAEIATRETDGARIESAEELRAIALRLLRERWVLDGAAETSLKVAWWPEAQRLELYVVPEAAALMRAAQRADERAAP